MNVVTDVRTTQRTCKRTSGRTRDVRVDGRVRTSGRTCERTYVRWHVHLVTCARTYENKVDSSRPYFGTSRFFLTYLVLGRFRRTEIRPTRVDLIFVRARARDEWTCQRTYVRSHVRPLVRTRPSTRTSRVRPLVRLHVRWVVRTSVTTFICTRHQTYALQDHYLLRDFKKS